MLEIALSVHNEKIIELTGKVNEVQGKLDAAEARNVELSSKVTELEKTIELSTKRASHQKLFDAGNINAAQLKALNEGKGMLEVLALNEKMNSTPAGGTQTPTEEIQLSESEKKVAKDLGLTEEEYKSTNF